MTGIEKEKTINGIDVSECEHHYTNLVDRITYHGCSIYEQTNELGYSQDTLCEQNPNCYYKQLKRLQEEYEELKKRCEELDKMTGIFSVRLANKYKQALEEIKEKCFKMCNICDNIDGETYLDDCNSICEYCKIVKLINEVLNEQK